MRIVPAAVFLVIAACAAPSREQADTSAAASMSGAVDSTSFKVDSVPTRPGSRPMIEREQRDSTGRILGRDRAKPIDVNDPKRQMPTIRDTLRVP
jgi:hypothetical protein